MTAVFRTLMLLIVVTPVICKLSGDTRSICQNRARDKERQCEADADAKYQQRMQREQAKRTACEDSVPEPELDRLQGFRQYDVRQ